MSFVELHKRVTYLFAGLGFAALTLGADVGPAFLAIYAVGFVASWFFESPRIHSARHATLVTVAALGSFAAIVLVGLLGGDPLELGLGYAGLLQLTRLFQRRTATEHLHVVGLGFLHLLAGTLLSTGLDYAVVFFGFVVVTPWMLSLTHLRAEIERKHATEEELKTAPTERLARVLASRDLATRGFLLLSSLLSLPLFLITATFFLLFPRVGLGMFTFGQDTGRSTAGFGSSVDLGGFGTIRDDPTVVARVFPSDLGAQPAEERTFRLRGTSFDRYDGVRWSRTVAPGRVREGRYAPVELFGPRLSGAPRQQVRIVVEALEDGVIFLPERTTGLSMRGRIESGLDVPRSVRIRPGIDVRAVENDGLDLDYVALVEPTLDGWPESLDEPMRTALLEVPPALMGVGRLADEVAGDAETDSLVAERILRHLRDSGRYRYSLTRVDPGGMNPLLHFLQVTRSGHCELYATAMAVMLRARGIPARNVTGFLGGRFNPYGRYYAVRQGDAHSWVEAYVDGRFVTFDPTPTSREAFGPSPDALTPLREWMDALRMRWSRDVVGYDMRRQMEGLLALRDRFRAMRGDRDARAGRREIRFDESEPSGAPAARTGATGFALAFGALALVALGVLVHRRRRATAHELDASVELYRELEQLLAARGLARPPHRTPLEHAHDLSERGFEAAAAVEALTSAYSAARYAGQPIPPELRSRLAQRLREVARARAHPVRAADPAPRNSP